MPGLSSSTMNLKFMQRATARAPTSAPPTPGPSTPKPASSSTPGQGGATGTAIPTPDPVQPFDSPASTPLIASEEPYRWTITRPSVPVIKSEPGLLTPQPQSGVKFESSYLPFMDQSQLSEAGPSNSSSSSTKTLGGGGRMVFGYKEPEQEDLEKDEEEGSEDDRRGEDVVINVREKGKGKREHMKQRPRPMAAMAVSTSGSGNTNRGFMRPKSRSISPEPERKRHGKREQISDARAPLIPMSSRSGAGSTNPINRHSNAKEASVKHATPVKVKTEPSSQASAVNGSTLIHGAGAKGKKRKQSQSSLGQGQGHDSPKASNATTSDKKPRLGPSMLNDYPSQTEVVETDAAPANGSKGTTSASASIDAREQALKAQRKKEKNAKKKARKSAEKIA